MEDNVCPTPEYICKIGSPTFDIDIYIYLSWNATKMYLRRPVCRECTVVLRTIMDLTKNHKLVINYAENHV